MGKEVTHAVRFRDPRQAGPGPDRELFVLTCDDGSVYEFQKFTDDRLWSMRARGEIDAPLYEWSQRRAPLPVDVKDTLNESLGKNRWTK